MCLHGLAFVILLFYRLPLLFDGVAVSLSLFLVLVVVAIMVVSSGTDAVVALMPVPVVVSGGDVGAITATENTYAYIALLNALSTFNCYFLHKSFGRKIE